MPERITGGGELAKLGYEVRLIAPAYVKPFVKRQKNDAADAGAICEAAQRPICFGGWLTFNLPPLRSARNESLAPTNHQDGPQCGETSIRISEERCDTGPVKLVLEISDVVLVAPASTWAGFGLHALSRPIGCDCID